MMWAILTWHGMLCRHFSFNGSRQSTTSLWSTTQLSSGTRYKAIRYDSSRAIIIEEDGEEIRNPNHLGHNWNGGEWLSL